MATFKTKGKRQTYGRERTNSSVFKFFRLQSERLLELNRERSSEILRSTLNKLMEFRRGTDLTFSMFDSNLMESFEAHMRETGLKRNTIGFYMRTLRSYYNIAVEKGIAEESHPFRKVYKSKDKTVKRALSICEIRRIKALDLSGKPNLDFARDMLLISFYARGMSFVDMAYLKKTDLRDGHVIYCRRKTGQTLCVEWVEQIQQIMSKYPRNETCYLLPIITQNGKNARRQYLNQTQFVYRNLKTVGQLAKVSGVCTMYRARHSWATLAHNKNVPISIISEALGHDNEKTTEIYLDSIQNSVVDNINRQLIKEL